MSAPGAIATAPEQLSSEQRPGRRLAILETTVRILGTRGLDGVTHRAVAAEADVPLAATTYYFASKAELLGDAPRVLAEDEVEPVGRRAAELSSGIEHGGEGRLRERLEQLFELMLR